MLLVRQLHSQTHALDAFFLQLVHHFNYRFIFHAAVGTDDDWGQRFAILRATANRCRAAYGVKDSVRDVLPQAVTEPFLESVDRLIRELNRSTA